MSDLQLGSCGLPLDYANGGRVLACFPGLGTRPKIAEERRRLIAGAANAGLSHVDTRSAVISYETPPFERSALAVAGITNVPPRWRRGDLLTFVRIPGYANARPSVTNHEENWIEVDIHGVRLKVRRPSSFEFTNPSIESVISGDVLPSVSRRDPRRARADIWTPTNRIFGCRGRAMLLQILRAIASRKASRSLVTEMLGRSLFRDEITQIEDATRQVRSLVREERASLKALGAFP